MYGKASFIRLFYVLGLLVVILLCIDDSAGIFHRHNIAPRIRWKYGSSKASSKYGKEVSKILIRLAHLFPDFHDLDIHGKSKKSYTRVAKEWEDDLLQILESIRDLVPGHGHHHHHGGRSGHNYDRDQPTISDVLTSLTRHDVMAFSVKMTTPLQRFIEHTYNSFFANPLRAQTIPTFSSLIKGILDSGREVLPINLIKSDFKTLRKPRKSPKHSSSSGVSSSSSSSSSNSGSKESKPHESLLYKMAKTLTSASPVLHPERHLTTIGAFTGSGLFKSLEKAFQQLTGREPDVLGSGVKLFERLNTLNEWLEDDVLPSILRFSENLNVPLTPGALRTFWTFPFEVFRSIH